MQIPIIHALENEANKSEAQKDDPKAEPILSQLFHVRIQRYGKQGHVFHHENKVKIGCRTWKKEVFLYLFFEFARAVEHWHHRYVYSVKKPRESF